MQGFNDVMLDLETMDSKVTAAITAIGAVAFNSETGEFGPNFYEKVDLQSCLDVGLTVGGATIGWWLTQGESARLEMAKPGVSIAGALARFATWLDGDELVWGNGAAFDNTILSNAYVRLGGAAPWRFWNDRCYRTVKSMNPDVPFVREGTHHNALHDAVTQAKHLVEILKRGK